MIGHTNLDLLNCHVTDIDTAVSSLNDVVVRAGKDEDLSGSDIVIMAGGAPHQPSRKELLQANVPLIRGTAKKIERFCPDAVVITVTNPVDHLNYAMHLSSKLEPKRLIGYSLNDSIRFRMMVARALGVKSTQVEAIVMGEHTSNQVLLSSSIRVVGQPISVGEDFKQSILSEMANRYEPFRRAGRNSGWTSAVGLASIVSAITQDTKEIIPCSAVLHGEYGCQELKLTPEEQRELENSINALKAIARSVEEVLGLSHF